MIPNVLTIAGTDPTGGAGVQADLKSFAANGAYGMSVITALVAQNTQGVRSIFDIPTGFIRAQIDAVFEDVEVHAVKIGMLSRPEVIEVVADGLDRHGARCIVLDPVMVAKSGHRLLQDDAVAALRQVLLPRAQVITPNLPEAGVLLDEPPPSDADGMPAQARRLRALGAASVLLKGGHLEGDLSVDVFDDGGDEPLVLTAERVPTRNTHGTGCTLSAALTALLAQGLPLRVAVGQAKAYLTGALRTADRLDVGRGQGPVHHFHALWPEAGLR